ncbi:MAG: hypothetical protein C7B47_01580 [Sulfobacillus thermosulfidooxidans]|uniref:Major facilitator superfamily (MFS) profile domain-containing protein n=1 Tax=Sulfobacillus thermosulfidooxidans TaxID=28034 RepID=A0A2T2X4J7_SULTH|nr:MAG: hypothetical protein C7B47_01580 [Sulfobacillus thermosulfidooxidans]
MSQQLISRPLSPFNKLWMGQSISFLGSEVTTFALPFMAVILLHSSPQQVGLLNAVQTAPVFFFSLFAGVVLDRVKRRRILMLSDFGRAFLVFCVPILAGLNLLSMGSLYTLGFCIGTLTVFFDVGYQAYLPTIMEREDFISANSQMQSSKTASQVVGPTISGLLVNLVGAPLAMVTDGLSYVASAIAIATIDKHEASQRSKLTKKPTELIREATEGLRFVVANRMLWALVGAAASFNFFAGSIIRVLLMPFALRTLHLNATEVGIALSVGSVGAFLGARLAPRLSKRIGVGKTIVLGSIMSGMSQWVVALASGSPLHGLGMLGFGMLVDGFGALIFGITQSTVRLSLTPEHLQGRVSGAVRLLVWGLLPFGGVVGGYIGTRFGLRTSMEIAAVGASTSTLWVLFSPVRKLQSLKS